MEIVKSFKYLDTLLDESLSFCDHVSQHILQLVYRGLIESVISFKTITWYGNVSPKNKIKLARVVVYTVCKVIGNEQKHLPSIYNAAQH